MARFEQIQALMTELGPIADPLAIEAFEAERCWGIGLAEDLAVIVDYDEGEDRLVLSAQIGMPAAGDRAALYEILLRHNFHWDRTGGSRFAVDGPAGSVALLYDINPEALDARRLAAILARFGEIVRAWREIVTRPPAERQTEGIADAGDMTMIRI